MSISREDYTEAFANEYTDLQYFARFAKEESRLVDVDVREIAAIEEQRADGYVTLWLKSGIALHVNNRFREVRAIVRDHLPIGAKHG